MENNEIALNDGSQNQQIIKSSIIDISKPFNLDNAQETPFDLMTDYWTPQNSGETKRVVFAKIGNRQVQDSKTGEVIELECAFFLEPVDGNVKMISNGSRRLVGAMSEPSIVPGMAFIISYKGKKRFRNGNTGDDWSVKPLIIQQ